MPIATSLVIIWVELAALTTVALGVPAVFYFRVRRRRAHLPRASLALLVPFVVGFIEGFIASKAPSKPVGFSG